MYLLDTNILSELAKVHPAPAVVLRFHSVADAQLLTSSICIEEIRFGCASSPGLPERWQKVWNHALWRVTILGFDSPVATVAGDLRAEWKTRGTPMGYRDGLIAATAKALSLILVTRNVKHFDHVNHLRVENWFEPLKIPES